MANVLVPRGYDEERRIAWERICRDARAQFTTQGYAIVRELIPPVHLAALRRYYRALVAGGRLPAATTRSRSDAGSTASRLACSSTRSSQT